MAEEIKDSSTTKGEQSETSGGQGTPEGGEKLILGKFRSQEDLEKSYKELEGKLGGWKEKEDRLKELETFEQQVAPVVNFVWSDKEALSKYQKYVTGETTEKEKVPEKAPSSTESQAVQEVYQASEQQILSNFEKSHGFESLSDDDKARVRKEIGKTMGRWLGGKSKPTLSELPTMLEDAYTLVSATKIRESAKGEGAAEFYVSQLANLGQSPTSSETKSKKKELTQDQKRVARKMGISEEDYLASLSKLHTEKVNEE